MQRLTEAPISKNNEPGDELEQEIRDTLDEPGDDSGEEPGNELQLDEPRFDEIIEKVYRDFVVPESANGQRIDLFLTQACDGYSRTQIRQAVQGDGASVDGRIVRPSLKVKSGQQIRFELPPPPSDDTIPENIPLSVIYEDDGLVVIDKPAGMVVHPARGNWTGTLTSALAYRFQSLSDVGGPTRPGIVHRLDRDTSGVIVVAKTNAVHISLSEQFANRVVQKEYFAISAGTIDRDRDVIEAPIGRHPYQRDKQAIREGHKTSKTASTFYEVISRHGRYTQVRVRPKTGRTHQIRVHLSHIGAPIVCDRLYAGHAQVTHSMVTQTKPSADDPVVLSRQALHARSLTIANPQSGKEMTFEAPIPADIQQLIDLLS